MITRLLLRVASLGAKFLLTVVLTRQLGFSAVAVYGLTVAAAVVASKLLGLGFSSELNRRLSVHHASPPVRATRHLRNVYFGVYAGVIACALLAVSGGWIRGDTVGNTVVLVCVLLVACSEHYGFEANAYVFSLHRTEAASIMLFCRTGGWALLAIGALLAGVVTRIESVLAFWIAANLAVVVWAWAVLRRAAAASVVEDASGWRDLKGVWSDGIGFYVASVFLSALQYAERFVASSFLSPALLGHYVFAWSIANAVQTVPYAAVVVSAGPRLARRANTPGNVFDGELKRSAVRTASLAACVAGAIAVAWPLVCKLAHTTARQESFATLAVLLVSFVLRALTDLAWASAVALQAGKEASVVMALAFLASLGATLALVAWLGASAPAWSHLAASILALAALAWIVRRARTRSSGSEPCDARGGVC